MIDFAKLLIYALAAPFRTQARLEAEITLLRHQLNVLQRQASTRLRVTPADRLLFVWLCRPFPSLKSAITIVQPDTVLRWHRSGFRLYWRWKSRSRGGRHKLIVPELVARVGGTMRTKTVPSFANPSINMAREKPNRSSA